MSDAETISEEQLNALTPNQLMVKWMETMEDIATAQTKMLCRIDGQCNPNLQPEYTMGMPVAYHEAFNMADEELEKNRSELERLVRQAHMIRRVWANKA